ncbi:MAG: hydrogenase/urease maturation nickel metallochaperone HypA [bacterium]
MKEVLKMTSGEKPSRIIITVGEATSIDAGFLRHSFNDHIFPEMNWKDIALIFEKEKPALRCGGCGKTISESSTFECPFCGSSDIEITGGNRVYVKEIVL